MKIIKRNGAEESFDTLKIVNAVQKACNATENAYLAPEQLTDIADYVEYKCNKLGRAVSVEEIQDMVENQLMAIGAFAIAKNYVRYRYDRSLVRKANTTDNRILSLIECNNEEVMQENSNKNPDVSVKEKCLAVLKRYGLAPDIRGKYPFQLSGGMTRRVLISTAVMEKPKLVIADEPTPGLHLEAATRVMGHFREMADDGAGVLLITHDLELALLTADRVIVLYGGRVVEETDAAAFQDERNLKHPYTKALFRSMPKNWKKDGEQLCDMGEILEDMRKEYGR